MLALAALLVLVAGALARQQLAAYRASQTPANGESDLFNYTRKRLHIRLAGSVVLTAIGITLAIWEIATPLSAENAQRVVSILIAEVLLLFVVAFLDLRETGKRRRI